MMKKYLCKALKLYVGFFILFVGFDAIFLELKPLKVYAISGIFFVAFVFVFNYLDDKGWNSWKRIGGLFRRKK